jgi:hypothetical protein
MIAAAALAAAGTGAQRMALPEQAVGLAQPAANLARSPQSPQRPVVASNQNRRGRRARCRARAVRSAAWQGRHPGRADRLLAAVVGAQADRVLPAEQPTRPAQPAGQPGQVPTVTAGAGDLVSPGVAGAAAPGPTAAPLACRSRRTPRPGRPPAACTAPTGHRSRPGAARRSRGRCPAGSATAGSSGRTGRRPGAGGSARSPHMDERGAGRGHSSVRTAPLGHAPARLLRTRCR